MLCESNSSLVADDAYGILKSFPEMGYFLDLGHLNTGYGGGKLGCGIDDFVRGMKDRVVSVHVSNDSGDYDENRGLEDDTMGWRYNLDMLDFSRL